VEPRALSKTRLGNRFIGPEPELSITYNLEVYGFIFDHDT
jgi:hypothetical protein